MENLKKIQYNSPVILTYTFLSLFILIIGEITKGYTTIKFFSVYRTSFFDILAYLRVFTHILGHTNFQHFFNNFLIILIVGPMLEEKYGSRNLLIIILITAFTTGIIQIIISSEGLLGASGIAFMLIILTSFVNIKEGKIPMTTVLIFTMYIGKEIYYGIINKDNISQITHIVGGICGIILGYGINKEFKRRN